MPICQFGRIYPYHPEYLQAWAIVSLVCGIVLLVEALATSTLYFALRHRMIPRWQPLFALAPLAGSVGALLLANNAHYWYWYYTTQFSVVLGEHPGQTGFVWGCWTQHTVNQIQGLGIVTLIGTAVVVLMGVLLMARWAFRGRGSTASANAVAPTPQPA